MTTLAMIRFPEIGLLVLSGAAAYLVGAIPFGLLVGFARGVDVRKAGSGNIGASNVGRLCGRHWGVLVLLLDAAKGFLPCLFLAPWLGRTIVPGVPFPDVVMQCAFGIGAIAGHLWPIYLGFKGGKGIATAAGVFLAIAPWALLCAFIAWLFFTAVTKYISIGSIASVIALSSGQILCYPSTAWSDRLGVTIFAVSLTIIAIWKHRSNVKRLFQGTEPKISLGRKAVVEPPGGAGKA
jgi:glycerol-3-phosphate acyltransferase PlsY